MRCAVHTDAVVYLTPFASIQPVFPLRLKFMNTPLQPRARQTNHNVPWILTGYALKWIRQTFIFSEGSNYSSQSRLLLFMPFFKSDLWESVWPLPSEIYFTFLERGIIRSYRGVSFSLKERWYAAFLMSKAFKDWHFNVILMILQVLLEDRTFIVLIYYAIFFRWRFPYLFLNVNLTYLQRKKIQLLSL